LGGTLALEDGCLLVLQGGNRVLPAFADDRVVWDPATNTLAIRGVPLRVGDTVLLGGHGLGSELPDYLKWVNPPSTDCRFDQIWLSGPPSGEPAVYRTPPPGGEAEMYANDIGVSIEEAKRRLGLQGQAGEVAARLQAVHTDRLSGVWLEHSGEFRVVAWYTGSDAGLEDARAIAADAPLPVEIRTGASYTRTELETARDKLMPRAQALFHSVGSYTDERTGAVVLDIENRPPNAARADELARQLSEEFGVRVVINVGR
jgi:hypothetical protein